MRKENLLFDCSPEGIKSRTTSTLAVAVPNGGGDGNGGDSPGYGGPRTRPRGEATYEPSPFHKVGALSNGDPS